MNFLYDKNSHFNMANMVTYSNISFGIISLYFVTHQNFFLAALFAWIAGGLDIVDGKIARKYKLSTQFGIQLDSYADFMSFVVVPSMYIYFAVIDGKEFFMPLVAFVFIYYIISGLRRLIMFNINSNEGEVAKHFVGFPTPLGAIALWLTYLIYLTGILNEYVVLFLVVVIGHMLNSKVKIPHP